MQASGFRSHETGTCRASSSFHRLKDKGVEGRVCAHHDAPALISQCRRRRCRRPPALTMATNAPRNENLDHAQGRNPASMRKIRANVRDECRDLANSQAARSHEDVLVASNNDVGRTPNQCDSVFAAHEARARQSEAASLSVLFPAAQSIRIGVTLAITTNRRPPRYLERKRQPSRYLRKSETTNRNRDT